MKRPTSFRLAEDLLERLDAEATDRGLSLSALVATILDEGLKTRRFPGIVYRDGPTGRRAGLVAGPDVWEIIRDLKRMSGDADQRVRDLMEETELTERQVRLAMSFYAAFPDEIEKRVGAAARMEAEALRDIERGERLLRA
jgi:hypothetical protein